jgi:hypothetical protein
MNTTLKRALYLDDLRTPTVTLEGYEPFSVVRNYDEFVSHIQTHGIPDFISFDHDLADEHMHDWFQNQARGKEVINYESFQEKTGMDCMKWLCNTILDEKENGNPYSMPVIRVHSANVMGSQNMLSYAASFCHALDLEGDIRYMVTPFKMDTKVED